MLVAGVGLGFTKGWATDKDKSTENSLFTSIRSLRSISSPVMGHFPSVSIYLAHGRSARKILLCNEAFLVDISRLFRNDRFSRYFSGN